MIKKISIEGYKSIKELKEFELKPLNVLIGPNKGGKSNFLDFLSLIGEAARGRLSKGLIRREGISQVLWAGGAVPQIGATITSDYIDYSGKRLNLGFNISNPYWSYSFDIYPLSDTGYEILELVNDGEIRSIDGVNPNLYDEKGLSLEIMRNELFISQIPSSPPLRHLSFINSRLREITYYKGFNTKINSPIRKPVIIESSLTKQDTTLDTEGDNLTNVYYHLFNNHDYIDTKNEILSIFESVFQGFKDIAFPPIHGKGGVQLGWHEEYIKRPLYQSELSDGTLRFLCLIAIFLNPNPPNLICIDEPEIGLHPYMMDVLAEIIINASERSQIILTTHSPRFLRNFKPEDIVVVENENGESKFNRPDPERLEKWLKSFHLGKLYEMGELGGLM